MKNKKIILKLYQSMIRTRMVEEEISKEYTQWKMRCPVHLSIGQEAISAPLSCLFDKKDELVSGHRAHAHYLCKGGNLKSMISEIYGKESGCSGGRGGSMHLTDLKCGFILSTAIVANTIPIGVGLGLAKKIKNEKGVVIVFFGDGAIEEGVFYESINFAILKKLPIIFVCENNNYSVYTGINLRQPKSRPIYKMVKNMGIKSIKANGNQVIKVYDTFNKAKKFVNNHNKPVFLEFDTFRQVEHCGPFKDDQLGYRSKKELNYWKTKDPIINFEKNNKKIITESVKRKIIRQISKEIQVAFLFAKKSKFPNSKTAFNNIYAKI